MISVCVCGGHSAVRCGDADGNVRKWVCMGVCESMVCVTECVVYTLPESVGV